MIEQNSAVERVSLEVQVAFFNMNGSHGLVVSGLGRRGSDFLLPRDWVRRSEEPTEAAVRVLTQVAGATTAVHEPEFVFLARTGGRGLEPAITATFTAIGRTPDPRREWSHFCVAQKRPVQERVRRAEAVLASMEVIRDLVSKNIEIAARLAANKDGLFTLKDLRRVLHQVTGREVDAANLRRRLESCIDLFEVVNFDEVMQLPKPPKVTRGRRSTWYRIGSSE